MADSGSMEFRPGVSIRRPNVPPSTAQPTASGSAVPSTPSKWQRSTQATPTHHHLAGSSDTEGGPSARGTIPLVMTRNGTPRVNITPGISRVQSRPFQPPRPMDTQPSASTSRAIGPPTILIPTVRPTVIGSDERITQTSGDHMGPPASEPVIVDDPASPERRNRKQPRGFNQPGLSRIHNATGLQTPPATQPSATNFPVDPSILEFTNLSQDEPLPPGVPQILIESSPELNPAPAVGVDEIPPPPPLPIES
ncbi:hypothetical protein FRC11_011432 [Ceratobasidium sp. 423]|nr:hypothetical protein FRC11_011432 [Ceratobasidium sp. 423]